MTSGILQYTLGLSVGGFIGGLNQASAKLAAFPGATLGLSAILEGVQKKMEQGAGLKQLADQTGETQGSLYRLQQGLKAVGIDSTATGSLLFAMNRALGGISEEGLPTAYTFSQI